MHKILLLFLSTLACAQTPIAQIPNSILIGPEGITIAAISSPTAVLQFGIGATWCTTITAPKLPLVVNYSSPNLALCPFDPIRGVAKSIVAQQQATAYTVTLSNGTKVPVPALPPQTTNWLVTCKGTLAIPTTSPAPTTLSLAGAICTATLVKP